jgi:TPR repeat protein
MKHIGVSRAIYARRLLRYKTTRLCYNIEVQILSLRRAFKILCQVNLGLMYGNGHGVPKDYVMAHMYWNIAAVSGSEEAITNRGIVEKMMTATQLEKAQDLARDWMSKH